MHSDTLRPWDAQSLCTQWLHARQRRRPPCVVTFQSSGAHPLALDAEPVLKHRDLVAQDLLLRAKSSKCLTGARGADIGLFGSSATSEHSQPKIRLPCSCTASKLRLSVPCAPVYFAGGQLLRVQLQGQPLVLMRVRHGTPEAQAKNKKEKGPEGTQGSSSRARHGKTFATKLRRRMHTSVCEQTSRVTALACSFGSPPPPLACTSLCAPKCNGRYTYFKHVCNLVLLLNEDFLYMVHTRCVPSQCMCRVVVCTYIGTTSNRDEMSDPHPM